VGTGFSFSFSPTYQVTVGLSLAPGLSPFDRFFLLPAAAPVSFGLSAGLAIPNSGYSGSVGYLNVSLGTAAPNTGVQIQGSVSVGLSDPGTGRVSFSDLK